MLPQILSQLEILIEAHTFATFFVHVASKIGSIRNLDTGSYFCNFFVHVALNWGQLEIWIQAQIFETSFVQVDSTHIPCSQDCVESSPNHRERQPDAKVHLLE